MKNRTKIVCTIGPATKTPQMVEALLTNSMSIARINLAHNSLQEQIDTIALIRNASINTGIPCAIMADLSGPEIRTIHPKQDLELFAGQKLLLTQRKELGDNCIKVNYKVFFRSLSVGDTIIAGDGQISFKVSNENDEDFELIVIDGGKLKPKQRLTVLGKTTPLPPLTKKDIEDIINLAGQNVDFFALSFIRKVSDIQLLKEKLRENGIDSLVVAKIETCEAVQNFDEILAATDSVMIARGDLGIELPPEDIPVLQKMIIRKTVEAGKPVITATQMLESMVNNMRPTRAEANDVANAIFDGSDAVMLSEETAIGQHPIEAVRVMARIANKSESALDYEKSLSERSRWLRSNPTVAISFASCELAHNLSAKAIITATQSGTTARQVSKYRPKVPIIAVTPNESTYQHLLLSWGITPLKIHPSKNIDEMFKMAAEAAESSGLVSKDDTVVITAGVQVNIPGSTNLIKIHTIGT